MNKTLGAGIGALMISSSAMAGVVINEGDVYSPNDITNGEKKSYLVPQKRPY